MIIGIDLKRPASNLKPTFSATTMFLWWNFLLLSMLSMTTKTYDHRYWFEEVCFESETNVFCGNHFLIAKRLNESSVQIWRGVPRIKKESVVQQPFSYCETSPCCPWQPKRMMIGTDLNRSASNLKPTVSATTIFSLWNVSVLSMTANAWDHRSWFEGVCFESETNDFCNNHSLIVKRPSVVHDCFESETTGFCSNHVLNAKRFNAAHDNKILGSSALIWRGLLRIWNQRFLQQPFSYCETSQCCPWQPKPGINGTDLTTSASNSKPTISAASVF